MGHFVINFKRLLYGIITVLVFAIFISANHFKLTSENISRQQNEAIWYILELNKEYGEIIYLLQKLELQQANSQEVALQYELLWSRYKAVLNNSKISNHNNLEPLLHELEHHFSFLQSVDSRITPDHIDNPTQLTRALKNDFERLQNTFSQTLQLHDGTIDKQLDEINALQSHFQALLMITFMLCLFVIVLLYYESLYHHKLAMQDALTEINNRLWLNQQLTTMTKKKQPFRFYLIDLDGFKKINDSLGHQVGDIVLKTVAKRLQQLVNKHCFVARMGGDEFCLISTQSDNNKYLNQQIINCISKPVQYQHGFCHIAGSVGVSDYPQQSNTIYDLLQQADFAMYEAKQKGKNNIFFATEQSSQTKNTPSTHKMEQ
ncbi:GGDEF domain-containing protein [Photobacterium damselae subsp. damselae]|uniref:GGDEF domain-containing protein n=1 Tax=Photobacterium damselae TaxID=38293 RepID=UPI0010FD7C22|nr:GGDEF domain-containing protein [Photobacterium damselae]TLS82383.1 GGDEF domain-containing protein [Photobacterium damselae subsp. damselae]TLS90616.1 GGDEF domain-containing protein [Photobacterium damselae subsp. damselae]